MLSLSIFASSLAAGSFVRAAPVPSFSKLLRREVPGEHSHEPFLTGTRTQLQKNNPDQIQDVVFGLLGNTAAITGAGNIKDPECLQQAIADQAFTNAKKDNDVDGMVVALQFRALERNTAAVGLKSNQCESIKAVNPEIAAIQQHQDPASDGAAATNKAIVLALAKEIAKVGGDPQLALDTGTVAPGKIGDPTAKGNMCDDPNNPKGCIFTENLLVKDATAAEIDAAVKGISASGAGTGTASGSASGSGSAPASGTGSAGADAGSSDDCGDAAQPAASAANLDFGSCPAPEIIGAVGLDGRTEFAFEPKDKTAYNHGSAQNIGIITEFMCDNLVNQCGLKNGDATVTFCDDAATQVGAGKDDGGLADKWNALFGIQTNFANAQGSSSASTGAAPASGDAPAASGSDAGASGSATGSSGSATGAANLNFGSCPAPEIIGAVGLDGRKEFAFEPKDKTAYNHGSAQNIGIITDFMCDNLVNQCGLKQGDATVNFCNDAATQVGQGKDDGGLADKWNALFGVQTNFANAQGSSSASGAASGSAGGDAGASAPASTGDAAGASGSSGSTGAATAGNDFGSCPAPEIIGAVGLDGRTEFAFEPKDKTAYNHGSAQNIGIITQFMCDNLVNQCGLNNDDPTVAACNDAEAQVGQGKDDGALADKWNAFFGIQSNFANAQGSISASGSGSTGADSSASPTSQAASSASTQASGSSSGGASSGSTSSSGSSSSSGNFQQFTGTLGGAPPQVTDSGDPTRRFEVNGDTFVNVGAALQRSCAIQHNACADAANSGGGFAVSDCDAQEQQCNDANVNVSARLLVRAMRSRRA